MGATLEYTRGRPSSANPDPVVQSKSVNASNEVQVAIPGSVLAQLLDYLKNIEGHLAAGSDIDSHAFTDST